MFKHLKGFISNAEAQLETSKLSFSVGGHFQTEKGFTGLSGKWWWLLPELEVGVIKCADGKWLLSGNCYNMGVLTILEVFL